MRNKILLVFVLFFSVFLFTSCDKTTSGKSAYEIAVENGFNGTEEEWLESLKGDKGDSGNTGSNGENGKSAYEIAVENGFNGTEEEWLESLKGDKGDSGNTGSNGENGKSAYELYLESHPDYKKTEDEWLADLINDTLTTETYNVKFILEEEMIESITVKKGDLLEKPNNPTKEGYTFDGWYVDGEKWVFAAYQVRKDLELKAKFNINTYKIIINDDEFNYDYNSEIELPQVENTSSIVYEGYEDLNKKFYDFGSKYVVKKNDTLTLKSHHKKITFDAVDGECETEYLEVETGKSLKLPIAEKDGYFFKGWKYDDEVFKGTMLYEFDDDITLEAYFVGIEDLYEFDKNEKVTVTFWNTIGESLSEILSEVIEDFNTYYPNITINSTLIGGYVDVNQRIISSMSSGDYPSMAYCYDDDVTVYNEANITVPLNLLIANSKYGFGGSEVAYAIKESDIISGFRTKSDTFGDGKIYTLPFTRSGEVLYYNETLFDELELKVPETWEEMWEVCAKIKEIDPLSTPLGYESEANFFITLCEAYGYDYTTANSVNAEGHLLFDNSGTNAMMAQLKDYFDKGYFTTQSLYGTYTSNLFTSTSTNKCYMYIGSSAASSYSYSSSFKANIAPLPKAKNGKNAAISNGPSIVLFDKSEQEVVASWLFLQYLLTPEVQAKFSYATGYSPVNKNATDVDLLKTYLATAGTDSKVNFRALATKTAIEQANSYFVTPVFKGSYNVRNEIGELFVSILRDTTITSDNKTSKIKAYFEKAIKECIY